MPAMHQEPSVDSWEREAVAKVREHRARKFGRGNVCRDVVLGCIDEVEGQDGLFHGQSLSYQVEVVESRSYPAGAGRLLSVSS